MRMESFCSDCMTRDDVDVSYIKLNDTQKKKNLIKLINNF